MESDERNREQKKVQGKEEKEEKMKRQGKGENEEKDKKKKSTWTMNIRRTKGLKPCYFFNLGKCRFGDKCYFLHKVREVMDPPGRQSQFQSYDDEDDEEEEEVEVCKKKDGTGAKLEGRVPFEAGSKDASEEKIQDNHGSPSKCDKPIVNPLSESLRSKETQVQKFFESSADLVKTK